MLRVLVTGAAAGVGAAMAEAFLNYGARVWICDVNGDALNTFKQTNPSVYGCVANVAHEREVNALFNEMRSEFNGIDVLINNAGVGGPRAPLEETDDAAWRSCLDVNLTGAYLMMKGAIPHMKQQRSGSIINIATSSARTGLPNRSAYVAAKAGLIALTYNVAREVGPWNIRCNAVLPGIIDNERGRDLIRKFAEERDMELGQATEAFLSYISMKTMIKPREVADLCIFLGSSQAGHISGQAIGVDGNMEWEC